MNLNDTRQNIYTTALRCYEDGLFAGTSGNLSCYNPETGLMAITPSGVDYRQMKPEDVVIIRLDGALVEGGLAPSSEWRLHAEIYKAKPKAGAVIHTHSPYATSFAVAHEEIPVILIEMILFFGGGIPLAKFAIPGTPQVGLNAVAAMETCPACLMENHGVAVYGENLAQAYNRAVYVEDAAKICTLARQNGRLHLISPADHKAMLDMLAY